MNPVINCSRQPPYLVLGENAHHLGNTRVTFRADGPGSIAIDYAADYYPYAKILREYRVCDPDRYLSTYHERDQETGYDNRGARLYDSEIGRFLGVDPLDHRYPNFSPYHYVMDNPVIYVDPDGERTFYFAGLGYDPNNPQPYGISANSAFRRYLGSRFIFVQNTTTPGLGVDAGYVSRQGYYPYSDVSNYGDFEGDFYDVTGSMEVWGELHSNPLAEGEKLNFVGTSMGSVVAAQTAIRFLAENGEMNIDNLVLGGSPISKSSPLMRKLLDLREQGRIKNIIYDQVQIPGDNITGCAGRPGGCPGAATSMARKGTGHPHRAIAQSYLFGTMIVKQLLGEIGIEGPDVQRNVNEDIEKPASTLMDQVLTGTPASQN